MLHNEVLYMSNDAEHAHLNSPSEADEARSRREHLEKMPLLAADRDGSTHAQPDVESLRMLMNEIKGGGTALQAVAIAAVQILERVLCYERDAAEAALSLGQQEKLESMVNTVREAVQVLRAALSTQGDEVIHLCGDHGGSTNAPRPPSGQPWWFALTDALEVLEEGTGRMSSLTTAQPAGSPARRLSELTTQLLRSHHDALLLEADEWIT